MAEPATHPPDLSLRGERRLTQAEISTAMRSLARSFDETAGRMIGYQVNQDLDFSELADFLRFCPNNLGDPYIESTYGVTSRGLEREVLQYVAALLHADDQPWWGYVTSGGTEANLYGIYVGRNRLERGGDDGRAAAPIAYFSNDTHYSIGKAMDVLRVVDQRVASDEQGRIRIGALIEAILRNDPVAHPPLIVANVGTTFTGAYDDVEGIVEALGRAGIERYHLHVDAALGGFILPFLERAGHDVPRFDFRLPIDGLAVSGHKVVGTPFPCGVFLTRQEHLAYGNARQVEYIGSVDSTLAGSRSGLAPIALWYAIARRGTAGFVELAERMLATAEYARAELEATGWNATRADLSTAVVFDRPPDWVVRKWSLSVQGERCHLYAMSHLTPSKVDALLEDLRTVSRVLALAALPVDAKALDPPQMLRNVDLLAGLDSEDLWRVGRITTTRRADAGTYLCRQGDVGDELYVVVSGVVDVVDESGPEPRVTFVAGPGAAIGEIAVLADIPRIASLVCRTDTELLVVPGPEFRTLLHDLPVVSARIIGTLVRRLTATMGPAGTDARAVR